jgi:hypothetical protein
MLCEYSYAIFMCYAYDICFVNTPMPQLGLGPLGVSKTQFILKTRDVCLLACLSASFSLFLLFHLKGCTCDAKIIFIHKRHDSISLKIIFFIDFPDLVAVLHPRPCMFTTFCTVISQFVILAVGFSHDRSNTFEHFEA